MGMVDVVVTAIGIVLVVVVYDKETSISALAVQDVVL
jgi:hypothetical protein